uniref:phospholipid phosphatase-related protein type 4 n=1 Tax=Myxine glutinosa TaxID=7769 RepID=UPI0035901470
MVIRDNGRSRRRQSTHSSLPWIYFMELPIAASALVFLYFLQLTNIFLPVHPGFSCDPLALRLPYIPPANEDVPLLMLLCLAFAGPAAMIMGGEAIVFCSLCKPRSGRGSSSRRISRCDFSAFLRRSVRFVGIHLFGLSVSLISVDVLQLVTGRHAPFFLSVCRPNASQLLTTCQQESIVNHVECSGSDEKAINAARKSFPSEHATLAAYSAVYLSMYLDTAMMRCGRLLKPLLVLSAALSAAVCGLSRLAQYRSHPEDVWGGFLLGAGIAWYLVHHAVDRFRLEVERGPRQVARYGSGGPSRELGFRHPGSSVNGLDETDGSRGRSDVGLSRSRSENASVRALNPSGSSELEMMAPRRPMGKESMVTFSNTLPRVGAPAMALEPSDPSLFAAGRTTRRELWKTRVDSQEGEMPRDATGEETQMGVYLNIQSDADSTAASGSTTGSIGATRMIFPAQEEQDQASSVAKSSSARTKWLLVAERSKRGGTQMNAPRLMQVISLSKQQGLLSTRGKAVGDDGASSMDTDEAERVASSVEDSPSSLKSTTEPVGISPQAIIEGGSPCYKGFSDVTIRSLTTSEAGGPRTGVEEGMEMGRPGGDGVVSSWKWRPTPHEGAGTAVGAEPEGLPFYQTGPAATQLPGEVDSLTTISPSDVTLRRKTPSILVPERPISPDLARSVFYKGVAGRGYRE